MAEFSRHMKRWAALTVLLYAAALLLLTAPVLLIAFGGWAKNGVMGLPDALKIYLNWGYWLWLAVLVAGQALLLLLPINIAERRLPARRPLKVPVLVTGLFLANLFSAGLASLLCTTFRENGVIQGGGLEIFQCLNPFPTSRADSGWSLILGMLTTLVLFWVVWVVIFRNFTKSDGPDSLLKRITCWLLRGSILELLVARAQPHHRPPPRRLLRAPRHVLGHRHRHLRHAALLRPRYFLSVRRTIRAVEAETAKR